MMALMRRSKESIINLVPSPARVCRKRRGLARRKNVPVARCARRGPILAPPRGRQHPIGGPFPEYPRRPPRRFSLRDGRRQCTSSAEVRGKQWFGAYDLVLAARFLFASES